MCLSYEVTRVKPIIILNNIITPLNTLIHGQFSAHISGKLFFYFKISTSTNEF